LTEAIAAAALPCFIRLLTCFSFAPYSLLMRKSTAWPYIRILCALPFTAGAALVFFAFIPLTDDFGNPVYQSVLSRAGLFVVGIFMLVASIYVAVPGLWKKKRSSPSLNS